MSLELVTAPNAPLVRRVSAPAAQPPYEYVGSTGTNRTDVRKPKPDHGTVANALAHLSLQQLL